jgi:malate dehydrogenase (quinone)
MYDVVLIGAGIMSATLAKMLIELNPNFKILILESQSEIGLESSGAWNNAGTGHAALCELNYTPEVNGIIDIKKALHITESFEMSKQFWSYFVEKEGLNPKDFIHKVPHISFVEGEDNVSFLRRRYGKMKKHHFYKNMQLLEADIHSEHFTTNFTKMSRIIPLILKHRQFTSGNPIAITKMDSGTDVDYGKLTKLLINSLIKDGVEVQFNTKVNDIKSVCDFVSQDIWRIKSNNREIYTNFCFIGAGGASLLLLEKTKIPESKGYGGFPISGQWLVCRNPDIIKHHFAKVYGKASVGAPPMSVPHLDTRIIDGEKYLLFGPFAGFNTKFLKNGSYFDLFKSIKISNLWAMMKAGLNNMSLNKYLIKEVTASFDKKFAELKQFYPDAIKEDWELLTAGQRVQVIKKDKEKGGVLEFGTELITSSDGSMSALLGASPGASTSVHIMIELIERCFPQMKSNSWKTKMEKMVPSYGKSLVDDSILYDKVHTQTTKTLQLD